MSDLGVGFVDILPRSDKFTTLLVGQMKKALTGITGQVNTGLGKAFAAAQVGVVALGAAAVVGITKGIQATTEWAGEVRSLQRVTGLAAEDASKLAAAGNVLGISVSKLNIGFGLLAKNIVNGSTNFDKYNVATKDAEGNTLPFLEILGNVSDEFATLPKGPEQAAFAMNIFGRSGKDLIPVLQRGSEGLQELYQSAEDAGLVMSQDTLDASKNLSIAQRELGEAVKGASVALGSTFVPVLTTIVGVLTQVVELVQLIPKPILAIGAAAVSMAAGVVVAVKAWTLLKTSVGGAGKAIAAANPWVIAIGFALIEAAALADTFSISLAKVADQTGFTEDQLGRLDKAFQPSRWPSGQSFSATVGALDGVRDQAKGAAEQFAPLISEFARLGIGADDAAERLTQWISLTDGTSGALDDLEVRLHDNIDTITDLGDQYGKGEIRLKSYTKQIEALGFSHEEATQMAGAALDQYGQHLDKAGHKIRNFAGLTKAAFKEFRQSATEAFDALNTMSDLTAGNLIRDTHRWMRVQITAAADVAKLAQMDWVPDDYVQFLAENPAKLHDFVNLNRSAQRDTIQEWDKGTAAVRRREAALDDVTDAVKRIPTRVDIDIVTTRHGDPLIGPGRRTGAHGGLVSSRGIGYAAGGSVDTVPAMLSPGEFVLRRDAVNRIGINRLRRMNDGGYVGGASSVGGEMRISDWRTGLASLDVELAWEDAVRNR